MHSIRIVALLVALALLLAPLSAAQGAGTAPTVLYRLGGPSSFLSGCIVGPCLCPISLQYMAGTFGLTAAGSVAGFDSFAISDIDWFTHWNGVVQDEITGSGTYFLDDEVHRIVLDLQVNAGEPITIDSGVVTNEAQFPVIDITGLTDGFCFQEGTSIDAAPSAYAIDVALPDRFDVTWSVVPDSTGYDVVYGDLGLLRESGGAFSESDPTCLGNDVQGPALAHDLPLQSGQAVWFVVRGLPGPGYDSGGAAQVGSRDDGINIAPYACP